MAAGSAMNQAIKAIGKAKYQKKLPQKPFVFSLPNLYYRLENMNKNLCTFLTMLSTYGEFLSRTIMF